MSYEEPLLPLEQSPKATPGARQSMLRRAVVVGLIFSGALALAFSLPTNKNLPCPYCQISSFIGWLYFLAWSVSFWPQFIINWRRKSVEGLSFDFTVMNVLGFAAYTQFNLALFVSPTVRQEYMERFSTQDVPVELNDVVFGAHALIMSFAMAVQCLIYPKAALQKVSLGTSLGLSAAVGAGLGLAAYLAVAGEHQRPFTWLDLCYLCSFIKMAITLIKYIPQVHLNRTRQSTEGWSIDNVLLDLSGGVLSVAQLLVSCQVLHDWTAVTGNPIKFGLGLVSIGFDIVFMLQHYVWYRTEQPSAAKVQQQQHQQAEETVLLVGAAEQPQQQVEKATSS